MKPILGVALVVLCLSPATAVADGVRPWLAVGGGFHTFAMGDVNDEIAGVNALIAPRRMDEVNTGLGFGAAFGLEVTPAVSLAVEYERFGASTKVVDVWGAIEYDLPANALMAQVAFHRAPGRDFSLGFGAGAGFVSAAGKLTLARSAVGAITGDISGSGPALEAFATGEWGEGEILAIVPLVGFRYAKIGETNIDGQVIHKADGSNYSLDYSGLVARVMLKLFLR